MTNIPSFALMSSIFDYSNLDLPITEVVPDIISELKSSNTLLLSAPPGAGKSTLIPLTFLNQSFAADKKILMLEPRRLAAKSVAIRMAELLGEEIGKTVGYRIRFESKISDETKIEVVTEGILTRMLQSDNELSDYSVIIFDEFHERSIHADVSLALTRETQSVLREDLRVLVMSATLDLSQLSTLLKCNIIESKGRMFPVDIEYCGEADLYMIPEMISNTVLKAVNENEGDILVFLPGQGEIKKTEEILKRKLSNFSICPLYGSLPQKRQNWALRPDKDGKRKVVLATSIAETSLTIQGITTVVDCGFSRVQKYDPKSDLSRLETVKISIDSADQRAGRAGRLVPGKCYRMWTKATHSQLKKNRTPEIEETDLTSLALDLANWGIENPMDLEWLSIPSEFSYNKAVDALKQIEAIENNKITEHGKALNRIPCHPRIAHMLIKANDEGLLSLATDLAAVLEERDPLPKEAGIDINLRIEALRRQRSEKLKGRNFNKIIKVAESYRRIFKNEEDNSTFDSFDVGILLVHSYPERIAYAKPGNNAQFQLANGKQAAAGHKDDLAHESWLAVAHVHERGNSGKIFLASPLNPTDLKPYLKEHEVVEWNTKKGGVITEKQIRIGSIVLQSVPLDDFDEDLITDAICNTIKKEGEHLLDFNKEVTQWQNRILSLKKWNSEESWPDVSTETLLNTCNEWLPPYLNNINKTEDLRRLNLSEILNSSLDWELQNKLTLLAPTKLDVPSGSKIKLEYKSNGDSPILSVRIQEIFGLPETPKVNMGKNGVVMHLLSPGFKPVQITSDLENFWKETYFEVKKELKRHYPKHSWPEDPTTEQAVRGVKRKR